MSVSVFDSKMVVPNDQMLDIELDESVIYLNQIKASIKNYGDLTPEWKYYGQKAGWVLKLFCKKRNVLFIVPLSGYFRAVFTFGDKATDVILAGDFPNSLKHEIFTAKKFAEGRTVQLEVKDNAQCRLVLSLIHIKVKN